MALHYRQSGSAAIVELLLERGADVNIRGGEYGTAVRGAVASPHFSDDWGNIRSSVLFRAKPFRRVRVAAAATR
ncbi:hypothetical protein DFH06DRAFT_1220666 [Mycena polygramma]|nr:hypothetical protein DFH06DRAFT_1220666 [Mycena polygramma]